MKRFLAVAVLLPLLLVGAPGAAQSVSDDGVITAVWDDPSRADREARLLWIFRDDAGVERIVRISPALLQRAGGFFALNGKRVALSAVGSGADPLEPALDVTALRVLEPVRVASVPEAAPQLGSKPYAVLLCKFSDVAAEPASPATVATWMSNAAPGIDHYWREVSAGQMNVAGTQVFGWFMLPQPRSFYTSGANPNLTAMGTDCAAAADAQVNFAQFAGIVTQYNDNFTNDGGAGSAYGGARFMALDGPPRVWPFTWMPLWATDVGRYGVYAHEIGHSLGLPHSSGPYSATYDSKWDVMSNAYLVFSGGVWLPGHTIIAHKDALAWIPTARKRVVSTGQQTMILEQAEFPGGGTNPLLVQVPIPGTSSSYVVEARMRLGYDAGLPGEAVVIHRVTGACDRISVVCAHVVDPDGNGDPNDAGAMWVAGETFDGEAGVRVRVDARLANGWDITVTAGSICTLTLGQTTGGTVALTGGTATGTCGRSVTVTATPSAGNSFVSWSNGATANPHTFTLDQNLTLSATFSTVPTCSLTLNQSTGGTVALSSGSLAGACGRSVTVSATASPGYLFKSWTGGATANPYTFTLSQSLALSANFARQCALTLTQTLGGTVALTEGTAAGDCGRNVTVTATPTAGYRLKSWSTNATANPLAFALDQDLSLSATFVLQCALALVQTPGGEVSLTEGSLTGDCGRNVTIAATPSSGQVFIAWSNGPSTNPRTLAVSEVQQTVSATFTSVEGLASRLVLALLGGAATLSASEVQYLDTSGNANGAADLGDLLALIDRNPGLSLEAGGVRALLRSPGAGSTRIPVPPDRSQR